MKYILFFTLYIVTLFANTLNDYDEGLQFFEEKAYMKAYVSFEKAFYEDMANPKISFYMGRCSFEMGDLELAMLAYERVLILDETHIRSRLELARTYILLKMDEKAKIELNTVLKMKPPKQVEENIHMLIAHIEEKKKNSFWTFYFGLATGYDTNINANPGEEVLINYLVDTFNLNRNAITASDMISAMYMQEMLNVGNTYKFKDSRFFLESSFLIFAQQYDAYSEYNLVYVALTSALATVYKGYKISVPLNLSKVYYGGVGLLDSQYIQLKVEKKLTKNTVGRVAVKFQKKHYNSVTNKGRNSDTHELELGVNHAMGEHLFRLSYLRIQEEKNTDATQTFVNKDSDTYNLGYSTSITKAIRLNAQYSYINNQYEDLISATQKRLDKFSSYSISLGKKITKKISIAAEYKYTENASNYIPVGYDKSNYNIKLTMVF
ncbi:hypothetical protein JHD48_04885 [Sulfurimonas sp. SAG-AH-194-I05]|nr:tetratricopeptide repeat protein [Sulfurimonas sp. SAG-AH-194-I05]MDF1875065.1 hypothetical protein [Sulfurimonas sp. SAG-AH-194-I05]